MPTLLDELSGYEFEDAVAALFRELGYENVSVATRVADVGRDITMVDGGTVYVVECKHTDTVSRPVVQKLHSAVATYDHDGPKRGMVVTSGRFTGPAEEYAANLSERGDPHPIELTDGRELRELGESVGMDLYNGRIEIVCEATVPVGDPEAVLSDVLTDVENAPCLGKDDINASVTYRPAVEVRTHTRSTFETSVGVIHRIDRRDRLFVDAAGGPAVAPADVGDLLDSAGTVPLESAQETHGGEALRFDRTESGYREWTAERLCKRLTTTVSYIGDNNVTYTKECQPAPGDVTIESTQPVYIPRVEAAIEPGGYIHRLIYDAGGGRYALRSDEIRRCVYCGAGEGPFTYCENCGAIACPTHTETERRTGESICTGCSVVETFFFAEKHFESKESAAAFAETYAAMPPHRKVMENPTLAAAVLLVVILALAALVTML